MREDISREMPSKRFALKSGSGFLMQIAVKSAFNIFKKKNPNTKVGLTTFQLLRPRRVRLLSLKHREVCLCPYCMNIKYKVCALNRAVSDQKLDILIKLEDEKALVDMLLCTKEGRFYNYDCAFGMCDINDERTLPGFTEHHTLSHDHMESLGKKHM